MIFNMNNEFKHISVLLEESIDALDIKENGIYVDGTAGGAGHSREIAKRLNDGKLIALDRDPDAVAVATERLKSFNATVLHYNYCDIDKALDSQNIEKVDGVLLDLGVSSYQLDNIERGFSYHGEAPLDMRMSKEGVTAAELVNKLDVDELTKIFRDYGEEKFAYKIANAIVAERKNEPITTTAQLAKVISDNVPAAYKRNGNPSRKCFQALRIAVNGELDGVSEVIEKAFHRLKVGGRLAIITFHSLEDRIVKHGFLELCKGCICPPDIPVCVCHRTPKAKLVYKKPIEPSEEEIRVNQRSRSAKLRVLEKIKD